MDESYDAPMLAVGCVAAAWMFACIVFWLNGLRAERMKFDQHVRRVRFQRFLKRTGQLDRVQLDLRDKSLAGGAPPSPKPMNYSALVLSGFRPTLAPPSPTGLRRSAGDIETGPSRLFSFKEASKETEVEINPLHGGSFIEEDELSPLPRGETTSSMVATTSAAAGPATRAGAEAGGRFAAAVAATRSSPTAPPAMAPPPRGVGGAFKHGRDVVMASFSDQALEGVRSACVAELQRSASLVATTKGGCKDVDAILTPKTKAKAVGQRSGSVWSLRWGGEAGDTGLAEADGMDGVATTAAAAAGVEDEDEEAAVEGDGDGEEEVGVVPRRQKGLFLSDVFVRRFLGASDGDVGVAGVAMAKTLGWREGKGLVPRVATAAMSTAAVATANAVATATNTIANTATASGVANAATVSPDSPSYVSLNFGDGARLSCVGDGDHDGEEGGEGSGESTNRSQQQVNGGGGGGGGDSNGNGNNDSSNSNGNNGRSPRGAVLKTRVVKESDCACDHSRFCFFPIGVDARGFLLVYSNPARGEDSTKHNTTAFMNHTIKVLEDAFAAEANAVNATDAAAAAARDGVAAMTTTTTTTTPLSPTSGCQGDDGDNLGALPRRVVWFVDFHGYNPLRHASRAHASEIVSTFQQHFPERVGEIVLLRPPLAFNALFYFVRPLLAPDTAQQVVVLKAEKDVGAYLAQHCPPATAQWVTQVRKIKPPTAFPPPPVTVAAAAAAKSSSASPPSTTLALDPLSPYYPPGTDLTLLPATALIGPPTAATAAATAAVAADNNYVDRGGGGTKDRGEDGNEGDEEEEELRNSDDGRDDDDDDDDDRVRRFFNDDPKEGAVATTASAVDVVSPSPGAIPRVRSEGGGLSGRLARLLTTPSTPTPTPQGQASAATTETTGRVGRLFSVERGSQRVVNQSVGRRGSSTRPSMSEDMAEYQSRFGRGSVESLRDMTKDYTLRDSETKAAKAVPKTANGAEEEGFGDEDDDEDDEGVEANGDGSAGMHSSDFFARRSSEFGANGRQGEGPSPSSSAEQLEQEEIEFLRRLTLSARIRQAEEQAHAKTPEKSNASSYSSTS